MQNIGYQNRNAMIALGTFTFALFLYFIQLILTILMFIYLTASFQKCNG